MTAFPPVQVRRACLVLATSALLAVAGCSADADTDTTSTAPATTTTTTPVAAGSVEITGDVHNPTTLTLDALRALPAQTQDVTFESSKGTQEHTFSGPLLSDILVTADPDVDADKKNALLAVAVVATGADDYDAALGWGEFAPDFAGTPVLVAHTEDGQPLEQPRLVVPGDVKGGRYVSDLVRIRVTDLGTPAG